MLIILLFHSCKITVEIKPGKWNAFNCLHFTTFNTFNISAILPQIDHRTEPKKVILILLKRMLLLILYTRQECHRNKSQFEVIVISCTLFPTDFYRGFSRWINVKCEIPNFFVLIFFVVAKRRGQNVNSWIGSAAK